MSAAAWTTDPGSCIALQRASVLQEKAALSDAAAGALHAQLHYAVCRTGEQQMTGDAALMNTHSKPQDDRQALEESERQASQDQPGSFDEKALTDKVVEIPPTGKDRKPIRGLDAPDARDPAD